MKPPYTITPVIVKLVADVSEMIGEVNASFLVSASPKLRKQNQVKTIQSSLQIEGNTLSVEQVTALLENKRVLGPKKDILEVKNAIKVYESFSSLRVNELASFLQAHKWLMEGLVEDAGRFRKKGAGIVKGNQLEHVAPPAQQVPHLMEKLFGYLQNEDDSVLVKSCVFHYELEFIHPFTDGNGRMGRLWQTRILMDRYPLFEFLPFESLIAASQQEYYHVLGLCDKKGESTAFIEYMLTQIKEALHQLSDQGVSSRMGQQDRIAYFCKLGKESFTRQDYMKTFKHISAPTASRDLKVGLNKGLFTKSGDKRTATYKLIK